MVLIMNKSSKKLKTAQAKEDFEDVKPVNWLRSAEVREMLGISNSSLQAMRGKGLIPAYKLGEMWFYNEAEITEMIFKCKTIKNEVI